MRVLDGAVALFDAVAGVQAQTETVWGQAERHNVPIVAFVNKCVWNAARSLAEIRNAAFSLGESHSRRMDREGADLLRTISMMEERLGATALLTQVSGGASPIQPSLSPHSALV